MNTLWIEHGLIYLRGQEQLTSLASILFYSHHLKVNEFRCVGSYFSFFIFLADQNLKGTALKQEKKSTGGQLDEIKHKFI